MKFFGKGWLTGLVFYTALPCFAQNIVMNPGFEEYAECPPGYGDGGPLYCEPWVNGNLATADYFNACADGGDVDVPDNLFGSQPAHSGVGYAGFYTRESSIWREYVQVQLTEPCLAGFSYEVGFFVSLADLYCPVTHIGAYLSVDPPPGNNIGTLGVTPQIDADLGFLNDNDDWILISGCFTAEGGEQYITIGNFHNNADSPLEPGCTTSFASYYYIDDVSVVQGDEATELELELGDDVTTCEPYVIDPEVSDVSYQWSDGSNGPTLTVTASGVYHLTITAGCGNAGVDSVEVTFIGSPPVDCGPDEATICEGTLYTISLDPDAGIYLWQDGSSDSEYTITVSGTYSVSLDDGCDVTSDMITVEFLEAPDPISLGDDILLCSGEATEISLDSGLGDFLWQDGVTTSDYTITEAGTYSLTISNMCGSVSDEILVTSAEAPQVDLGDPHVHLCEGTSLEIQLDPILGDYLWQDGSTGSTYLIEEEGMYAVTLTNACGVAEDSIDVSFQNAPAPFSLGPDITLCEGESFAFDFDPESGDFTWQDGSHTSSYSITSGGSYALTISNACGSVSDEIVVEETSVPDIDLGPEAITLCTGDILAFNFDPLSGNYEWQDGSQAFSYEITMPGIYAVTVSNLCGVVSDVINVTAVDQPNADLGPDIILCPGQFPFSMTLNNSSDVTYNWQDGSSNPEFVIEDAGIYAVTVSNLCGSASDQITVSVSNANPVVTLPFDQELCPGEILELHAGNVIGEYLWQDGSTSETYTVNTPGLYSVTVTNGCGSDSDSITVSFAEETPTVNLGDDVSLCPGTIVVLSAGITGLAYTWSDSSTLDTLHVDQAGTYWLTVQGPCGSSSDTIVVSSQTEPPVLALPDTLVLCTGDSLYVEAGITGVSFLWSNGSNASGLDIFSAGSYTLTVTNACGSDTDTLQVIAGGGLPFVELGNDTTFCTGESLLLTPFSSDVSSWLWSDGTTSDSYMTLQPGEIHVVVSNACGTTSDSISVMNESPLAVIDLGADLSLCPGESQVLSQDIPSGHWQWSDGSVGLTYAVHDSGWVSFSAWNACGAASDSVHVTLLQEVEELNLGNDLRLCPGESLTIDPQISGVQFLWNDGSTEPSFTVDAAATVVLTISNACGASTDTILVIPDSSGPVADLGPDVLGCNGNSFIIDAGVGGVDYLWQDGSHVPFLVVNTSGIYSVTVTNACGTDTDSISVNLSLTAPNPDLGPDTTLCEGSGLLLHPEADAGSLFLWNTGTSSPSLMVETEGEYWLQVTNACGTAGDTIRVTMQEALTQIFLGPDTMICPGEMLILEGPLVEAGYLWQDGSTGTSMIAAAAQTFWLRIENGCGSVADSIHVSFYPGMPELAEPEPVSFCEGLSAVLDATQDFDATYVWNDGSYAAQRTVYAPGMYRVTITTTCTSTELQYTVTEDNCVSHEIFIPNVFSPNGDQVNDNFEVLISPELNVLSFDCSIFDRWGNHMFHTEQSEIAWDGTFNNEEVQPGVYVYVVSLDYLENGRTRHEVFKGDVTVVR